MGFISAQVLYKNEEFLACSKSALINTALVNNDPKIAWIYPNRYGYYELTFKDPLNPSSLTGVWVTEANQGMLLDGTLADVQAKLTAATGTVTPVYNGTYPSPATPVLAAYTITRSDDGTISDLQDFMLSYLQWAQPGTIQRTTYASPTSTYVFSSYTDPVLQGNDVLSSEAARVFLSNTGGSLTSGNKWTAVAYVNGDLVGTAIVGATNGALSTIVTALTADSAYGALGTWAVSGTSLQLTSTTVNAITIVLTQGT